MICWDPNLSGASPSSPPLMSPMTVFTSSVMSRYVFISPEVITESSAVATSMPMPAFIATERLKPASVVADTASSMPLPPPTLRLILLSSLFRTKSSKT